MKIIQTKHRDFVSLQSGENKKFHILKDSIGMILMNKNKGNDGYVVVLISLDGAPNHVGFFNTHHEAENFYFDVYRAVLEDKEFICFNNNRMIRYDIISSVRVEKNKNNLSNSEYVLLIGLSNGVPMQIEECESYDFNGANLSADDIMSRISIIKKYEI